ncbi:MAG: hypothetical protein M0R35_07190 [Candidatus Omnitrophica bacterium]|jgi:hypothetical protein|nr:hypothetical protein [Candidatus Omnitrophota bacterium]
MPFELFVNKKSTSAVPTISILKSGNIFINSKCYDEYFTGAKYINLYFNKAANSMGVQPVKNPEKYSYSMRQASNKKGAAISAVSFFKNYKIDYKKGTRAYNVVWNTVDKLVEVKLE